MWESRRDFHTPSFPWPAFRAANAGNRYAATQCNVPHPPQDAYRYSSVVNECIGDNALIEKAVTSQSAAITFRSVGHSGVTEIFPSLMFNRDAMDYRSHILRNGPVSQSVCKEISSVRSCAVAKNCGIRSVMAREPGDWARNCIPSATISTQPDSSCNRYNTMHSLLGEGSPMHAGKLSWLADCLCGPMEVLAGMNLPATA
jgi:hypothetical protein